MPFRNNIVAGNVLVRNAIQSQGFVAGTSGWQIKKTGEAEFNNVTIRGGLIVTNDAQSSNFSAGVTGWRLRSTGEAEFNSDVTIQNGVFATGDTADDRIVLQQLFGTPFMTFEANASQPSAGNAVIQALPQAASGTDDAQVGLAFSTSPNTIDTGNMQMTMSFRRFLVTYSAAVQNSAYVKIDRGSSGAPVSEAYIGYDNGTTDRYFRADSDALLVSDVNGLRGLNSAGTQTWFPLVVDGRANGGIQTTAIGTNTDTSIGGCNLQNTPVIQDRAYIAVVQIDYFRSSTGSQTDNRMEMKIWDGAVGGTQLGGTVRIPMIGGNSTNRRRLSGVFIWRAASTQVMANVNLSLSTTDVTASQNWTAERNSATIFLVMEAGAASLIAGL